MHDTGTNLNAMTDIIPNMAVIPTDNSNSSWTKDVLYIRNSDNTAWLSASGGAHLHNSTSPSAGGLLTDILEANQLLMFFDQHNNVVAADFAVEAGSGNITNEAANAWVRFNAPGSGFVAGARFGVGIAYILKSQLVLRMRVDAANNLTVRCGVTAERVDTAVGGDTAQKYGMEVCDSAGNAMDWSIFSAAGGSTRDATTATGYGVSPSRMTAYRLSYTPGISVRLFVDGTLAKTLTTSVPISGDILNHPRNIGIGIRANTGTARNLYLAGLSFTANAARTSTSGWF